MAALAGTGWGLDAANLSDVERAAWRAQALAWLRDEMAAWRSGLERGRVTEERLRATLESWRNDYALAGLGTPRPWPPFRREKARGGRSSGRQCTTASARSSEGEGDGGPLSCRCVAASRA
jgi:hypothetical protein